MKKSTTLGALKKSNYKCTLSSPPPIIIINKFIIIIFASSCFFFSFLSSRRLSSSSSSFLDTYYTQLTGFRYHLSIVGGADHIPQQRIFFAVYSNFFQGTLNVYFPTFFQPQVNSK